MKIQSLKPEKKVTLRLLRLLLAAAILYGCANESAPLGGKEDKDAPTLKEVSPPDKTIHFKSTKIQLTFSEFIQRTGFAQTIISPPLDKPPVYRVSRNKLTIQLKGELQPNTTYTINFGDDIKDVNAGNIASNFTYVFSTGDYIDSQQVSGKVIRADNGEPADGVIVSLYSKDSVNGILSSKPIYFAKTNKDGIYQVRNVRADLYNIFALKDQNFNYRFDQPNELIGFTDRLLDLTGSLPRQQDFLISPDSKRKVSLQSVNCLEPGKLLIAYSAPYHTLKVDGDLFKNGSIEWNYDTNDTLIAWYSAYYEQNAELFLRANDTLYDTARVKLKYLDRDSVKQLSKYSLAITNQSLIKPIPTGIEEKNNVQSLYGAIKINFSRPIIEISENKGLQILEDSIPLSSSSINWLLDEKSKQVIELTFDRKENITYHLIIPDSMFRDIFGLWNKRMVWPFTINKKDNYGNIALTLTIADTSKNYVVKLLNSNGVPVKTIRTSGTTKRKEKLNNIPAGVYHVSVIEDTNNNGRWDTGDFLLRIQPERVYNFKENYTLKGGWDLDVELKF